MCLICFSAKIELFSIKIKWNPELYSSEQYKAISKTVLKLEFKKSVKLLRSLKS